MQVNRSREWWLRLADSEPDGPFGAGLAHAPECGYAVIRRSFFDRICDALGFGTPGFPPDRELPGMAESSLCISTYVHFDWRDRLRVLVGGPVCINASVKTDVVVMHASTTVNVGVTRPGFRPGI